jgi:hypothetical protein
MATVAKIRQVWSVNIETSRMFENVTAILYDVRFANGQTHTFAHMLVGRVDEQSVAAAEQYVRFEATRNWATHEWFHACDVVRDVWI